MFCPRCKRDTLVTRTIKDRGVKVEHCSSCGGIWFERGELEKAVPAAVDGLRPPDDAEKGRRLCPECFEPMQTYQYPHTMVQVDQCGECRGIWLDAREFEEIRVVRAHMKKTGKLDDDPIYGIRGALLDFIDSAIHSLS
jgi:Zn-finger nucleic acid-binding protein